MPRFKHTLCALFVLQLSIQLTGCVGTTNNPKKLPSTDQGKDIDMSTDMFVNPSDMKDTDMLVEKDMGKPDLGGSNFPTQITTSGAEFSGLLRAGQSVDINLVASKDDRITLWLRKSDNTEWNPYVAIFQNAQSSAPIVYGNPTGNADASIPYRSNELDQGWTFFDSGTYVLRLQNLSQEGEGSLSFMLECRGGPCIPNVNDLDQDGVLNTQDNCPTNKNADQSNKDNDDFGDVCDNCPDEANNDQSDRDEDDVGDLCDPDFNANPFEGLSEDALKMEILKQHVHQNFSYDAARDKLYEYVDNNAGEVSCVYTGHTISTTTRPNGSIMNTEHTWPQSKGADKVPAKSDLHHLYATVPGANTRRSNHPFCEADRDIIWEQGGSKLGATAQTSRCFEPRDDHKGKVARALFYFSAIYGVPIPDLEEAVVRKWHTQYPVTDKERLRNQRVATVQKSRNPFVDHPDIVARISDF